jgi:hypothetical protein
VRGPPNLKLFHDFSYRIGKVTHALKHLTGRRQDRSKFSQLIKEILRSAESSLIFMFASHDRDSVCDFDHDHRAHWEANPGSQCR